ncbi:hypothetical protein Nepgr_005995 [Nepenthes gracilis]|uniref:Erythronate-4-phosphate dehydrogenase family protein n=1 Tax=Nepenthes gracilis TaxID=150966 RepID=A0AAD3XH55_NEPGR|nr:hypothetical protein Nepgr_005995 [Nepenthes gracilis]
MIMGRSSRETVNGNEAATNGFHIIRHAPSQPYSKLSASWFDLRVFYVRFSNFTVHESTPEFLTLNHIPLDPDTLLEVNGVRCSIYSDGISSLLRRDRVDKKSEEATFVCTDSIKFTGSVKFDIFNEEDHVLTGVLEMPSSSCSVGEAENSISRWSLNCQSAMTVGTGFLMGKNNGRPEYATPTIDVYVAGSFSGAPIILTKTLRLSFRRKHNRKVMLDAIPEYETAESRKDAESENTVPAGLDLQVAENGNYKMEDEEDIDNVYWRRADYMEGEDGELSWFNAGVRVGVGIGLGICLGIGIGVGLLVRTYQSTTRSFRRRLL